MDINRKLLLSVTSIALSLSIISVGTAIHLNNETTKDVERIYHKENIGIIDNMIEQQNDFIRYCRVTPFNRGLGDCFSIDEDRDFYSDRDRDVLIEKSLEDPIEFNKRPKRIFEEVLR
jgi:hypothetical protein